MNNNGGINRFEGMTPEMRGNMPENGSCRTLQSRLKMIDFALTDTILYLDAYPDSKQALEYYRRLVSERERLAASINEKCGPITARDNGERDTWEWTSSPWPWEAEAN